jgi:hypothetical protein
VYKPFLYDKNEKQIFVEKLEGKKPLGRLRHRWED